MTALIRRASLLICLCACSDKLASDGDVDESSGEEAEGSGDGEDKGEDEGEGGLSDIDLESYCPNVASPALAQIVPIPTWPWLDMGSCGHLVFAAASQPEGVLNLMHLDGSVEAEIATDYKSWKFSPGGGLLTVHDGDELRIMDLLRDTVTAAAVSDQSVHFGHVRTAHPDQREQAWLCSGSSGALTIARLDELHSLASGVRCASVVGSLGGTRLLFANKAGVVTVADADTDELWPTSSTDFDAKPNDGKQREDGLISSYDGRLGIHEVAYYEPHGHVLERDVLEARVLDLDDGQLLETCGAAEFLQAPSVHAPAFVLCDNRMLVWHEHALLTIADAVTLDWRAMDVAQDEGGLFFSRNVGGGYELLRASGEAPASPELLGSFAGRPVRVKVGNAGDVAIIGEQTNSCALEGCVPHANNSTWALHRWSAAAGLTPLVSMHGNGWGPLALFEDGAVLLRGAVVEDPPLPAPPESRLLLIDADGELVFDAPFQAPWSTYPSPQNRMLADGRVLLKTNAGQSLDQLLLFDRSSPGLELLLEPNVQRMIVDGRGQRLAVEHFTQGQLMLRWGTIP